MEEVGEERRALLLHAVAGRAGCDYPDNRGLGSPIDLWARFGVGGSGDEQDGAQRATDLELGGFIHLQNGRTLGPESDDRLRLHRHRAALLAVGRGIAADASDERGIYAGNVGLC